MTWGWVRRRPLRLRQVVHGRVAGRCAHLAEQCFDVAAALAWLEKCHDGRERDARRNPAARKVGDQKGGAVSLFSGGPVKARLLVGDEVDKPPQAGFCRRVRRGGPSGSSTRGSNDCLLADTGWCGVCERRGGRLTDDRLREPACSGGRADRCCGR